MTKVDVKKFYGILIRMTLNCKDALRHGATTFSRMTLGITTFSVSIKTHSILTLSITIKTRHSA
jgi:hypothetical protein